MAKGKGFDPVADANELAGHNINPYYWVNKVTSYTYARWMAEKKLAVIALPLYVLLWIAIIWRLMSEAALEHISVWKLLLDVSSSQSLALLASMLMLVFYTLVVVIMVLQLIFSRQSQPLQEGEHSKREKRHPKRRKDYH